jgi:membrane-bound serine protease (ClpP class)
VPRRVVLLALFMLVTAWPALARETAAPPPVDVIKVEGALDRPLVAYLNDRLDAAVADGAVVVLELDSAGTLDQDAIALADRIANLPVPVITWVGPVPARASGGGMLLMLASSLAAVAPGSQTGPLEPLDLAHPDAVYPDLDQWIDAWAAARGRHVQHGDLGRALTAQGALDAGYAQANAANVLDLLGRIDGTQVATSQGPVTLRTKIATTDQQAQEQGTVRIRFEEPGPIKRVQHAVATPSMVFFLLVFGLACIAFEFTQPGFGFAGFGGLFVLALAAYGIWVVPPSILGMIVLLAGIGLLLLDVVLRRLGVLTAIGVAAFVAGSVLVYRGVAAPMRISPWMIAGVTVATFLYYGFGLTVALQSRDRIASTQRGLIGLTGEARGRLAPDGPVYVKGSMWRGRSTGDPIASGQRVRVRGLDGLVLRVEAEPEGRDPDRDPLPAND